MIVQRNQENSSDGIDGWSDNEASDDIQGHHGKVCVVTYCPFVFNHNIDGEL